MSSLALMRLLESAPERYDAGMRVITLGRVALLQDALARAAAPHPGMRVLEIGCGTGSVTARLVDRGARVTAVDQNPAMLEQARRRLGSAPVEWVERTASEIDALAGTFDAIVASMSFSEMSAAERRFVLGAARHRLLPGGVLAVGDEVRPRGVLARAAHAILRGPQAALGWLLAGSVSRPVPDLAAEIRAAGFAQVAEERWLLGGLAAVVARMPASLEARP